MITVSGLTKRYGQHTAVDGQPVLVSEHVFPAHRTRFAVELPAGDGALPTGLRLVE